MEQAIVELEREIDTIPTPAFMREFQIASLRLRCAEIVWTNGSQDHRSAFEDHAERLYRFATRSASLAVDGQKKD